MIMLMHDEKDATLRAAKIINWWGSASVGGAMAHMHIPHSYDTAAWPPSQHDIDELWNEMPSHLQSKLIEVAKVALYGYAAEEHDHAH